MYKIDTVKELVGLIIENTWRWFPVLYIGSFIFCMTSFRREINKNNINLENIPNHEKIREIVELNRDRKSDGDLLTSNERDFFNENWEEISARIGKNNLEYINRFYGEKRKLNWASGFFGPSWLLYRGMLKEFLLFIIFIIFLFSTLFSFGVFDFKLIIAVIQDVISIIVFLLFGMFGDYYYFKSLHKRIIKKKGEITRFKLYFIIINLLFPPMIFLSWWTFMFSSGY